MPIEEKLVVWTAPARPFKRRNREYYITVIAIAAVVGLVIFLAEGPMPVILLSALIFLFYVLNTVEPQLVEYQVTSLGVKVGGTLTGWDQMVRFWFTNRSDSELLVFQTNRLPGRLELVINVADKEKLREEIKKYVTEEELPPTWLDKTVGWIGKQLPL